MGLERKLDCSGHRHVQLGNLLPPGLQATHHGQQSTGFPQKEESTQNNNSIDQRASQGVQFLSHQPSFWFFCCPCHFLCLECDSFRFYYSDFLFPGCFCLKLSQQADSPTANGHSRYLPLSQIWASVDCQGKLDIE